MLPGLALHQFPQLTDRRVAFAPLGLSQLTVSTSTTFCETTCVFTIEPLLRISLTASCMAFGKASSAHSELLLLVMTKSAFMRLPYVRGTPYALSCEASHRGPDLSGSVALCLLRRITTSCFNVCFPHPQSKTAAIIARVTIERFISIPPVSGILHIELNSRTTKIFRSGEHHRCVTVIQQTTGNGVACHSGNLCAGTKQGSSAGTWCSHR